MGIVPKKLQMAKVIPSYKTDDAEKFLNYICIDQHINSYHVFCLFGCFFLKILERFVFDRYVEYIDAQEIPKDKRFDFCSNHSTSMAIMQLVD